MFACERAGVVAGFDVRRQGPHRRISSARGHLDDRSLHDAFYRPIAHTQFFHDTLHGQSDPWRRANANLQTFRYRAGL